MFLALPAGRLASLTGQAARLLLGVALMSDDGERTEQATDEADEGGALQGPAVPVPGPHGVARRRRRRADAAHARSRRAPTRAPTQLLRVGAVAANPDPAARRAGARRRRSRRSRHRSRRLLVVAVVAVVVGSAPAQGGVHLKQASGRKFEHFNLVNGLEPDVRQAGAVGGGQGAAQDRRRRGWCCTSVVQGLVPVLLTAGRPAGRRRCWTRPATGPPRCSGSRCSPGSLLAAADVFVVMRRNRKQTRMTKKEVKDENKSSEGDPLIKVASAASRQLAMSRNRMIAAVADADVVAGQPHPRRGGAGIRARASPLRGWSPRAPAPSPPRSARRRRTDAGADGPRHPAGPGAARRPASSARRSRWTCTPRWPACSRSSMALRARGAAAGVHTVAAPALPAWRPGLARSRATVPHTHRPRLEEPASTMNRRPLPARRPHRASSASSCCWWCRCPRRTARRPHRRATSLLALRDPADHACS